MITLGILALIAWVVLGSWGLAHRATQPPGGSMGRALARGLPVDPGEAGLSWTDDSYSAADGLQLPLWRIEGDDPHGEVLIVLHDWGQSPIDALHDLDADRSGRREILLPTLRGHDAAPGRCTLGRRETCDLRALLGGIDGDVVLKGQGLGGLIALHCGEAPGVIDVTATDPWTDRGDGLRRVLRALGQPAFPFAWTARILLP